MQQVMMVVVVSLCFHQSHTTDGVGCGTGAAASPTGRMEGPAWGVGLHLCGDHVTATATAFAPVPASCELV